jgi:pyruvate kinase
LIKKDAKFIYQQQLEFAALSFVQRPEDIQDLLDVFTQCKNESNGHTVRPLIVAKIEKPQAFEQINEIIQITDGIMVARGDLGVEISLEMVPLLQKELILKSNAAEKLVITATQMLESMISNPSPTRAEVSDIANAVFDGTDAVMLSAETATGKFDLG